MTRAEVRLELAERLPDLREPCHLVHNRFFSGQQIGSAGSALAGAYSVPCSAAGCRGWVPKDWHLEDLLEVLKANHWCWELAHQWGGGSMHGRGAWASVWFYIDGKMQGPWQSDPNDDSLKPLDALVAAVAKARGLEVKA